MSVLLQCLQCPLMRVRRMVYFELDRREINNYSMSARYIPHCNNSWMFGYLEPFFHFRNIWRNAFPYNVTRNMITGDE